MMNVTRTQYTCPMKSAVIPQIRVEPELRAELESVLRQGETLTGDAYTVVIGEVVGLYIDDRFLRDGLVDTGAMRPLARLGYMDYSVVAPETMFALNRPLVADDGRSVQVPTGDWDGTYR